MSKLEIFENSEFGEIRTVEINNEPWFVGRDVATVLGYSNPRKAIGDHVDDEDKGVTKCDTLGGSQDLTIINESGLYSLILSSKLPNAKAFKRWVTSEVLPAIRKHGLYAIDDILENPDIAIQALTKLKEERAARKALELDNQVKSQQIAELQPKATYYDLILQCKDLLSVTEIAKDYGMSAKGLNAMLHELGVQYNQSGVWFLYARYQHEGYTQTKTQNYNRPDGTQGSKVHTYWTQKGRLFIYNLLKSEDILPTIEIEDEVEMEA
uniref:Repressor domain protein n=1 Tax=Siphoviridae sp. ctmqu18 TaxID=2825655 RepID=A0A8S5V626_9CAUD|nr:MAG TPA: repressor domain protein [Siphoviridae sp. ctmqu18]